MHTIWQVKVYEDDGKNYTLYFFKNREDVMESINTTWGKIQDRTTIHQIGPYNGQISVIHNKTGITLLHAEALPFYLVTEPIHF